MKEFCIVLRSLPRDLHFTTHKERRMKAAPTVIMCMLITSSIVVHAQSGTLEIQVPNIGVPENDATATYVHVLVKGPADCNGTGTLTVDTVEGVTTTLGDNKQGTTA